MALNRLARDASAEEILAGLRDHGHAVVERWLDEAEVARKKAELERILASVPRGRNDFEGFATQRVYALFAKTRCFDREAIDERVLAVAEGVLGRGFLLSAPTGICIGPGESAQSLHRDDAIYPLPTPHAELVLNSMWALDAFTVENGATLLVPGSHRWGAERPAEVPVESAVMPAGSVAFYLGSLLHGGGANRTQRSRLGVILEYCAGWVRPQESHLLGVPREVARQLPERLRELLGYGVHGAFLGYVDGRHPGKYLDDPRRISGDIVAL